MFWLGLGLWRGRGGNEISALPSFKIGKAVRKGRWRWMGMDVYLYDFRWGPLVGCMVGIALRGLGLAVL